MMNQRFEVLTEQGESHIYLKPNMPVSVVSEELNKKFAGKWVYIDYHKNKILNTAIMKKRGLAQSVIKHTGKLTAKAKKSIWKSTRSAGKTIWNAGEEVAPHILSAGKKVGTGFLKGAKDTINDIFSLGMSKAKEIKNKSLLETEQAKKEFERVLKQFKLGVLKEKGKIVTSSKQAVRIATRKASSIDQQIHRTLSKGERGMIVFDKFDIPSFHISEYGKYIKDTSPQIWNKTNSAYAEEIFPQLQRVASRGYWLDSEEWLYKKWKMFSHSGNDNDIKGVITNLHYISYGEKGKDNAQSIINEEIKKQRIHKYAHKTGEKRDFNYYYDLKNSPFSSSKWNEDDMAEFVIEDYQNGRLSESELWRILSSEGIFTGKKGAEIYTKLGYKPFSGFPLEKLQEGGVIKDNRHGGYDYKGHAEQIAKNYDLIILPKKVEGTNCFNCKFIKAVNGTEGFCSNRNILLPVTNRMCCALWDNSGVERSWIEKKENGGTVTYYPFMKKDEYSVGETVAHENTKDGNWVIEEIKSKKKDKDGIYEYTLSSGIVLIASELRPTRDSDKELSKKMNWIAIQLITDFESSDEEQAVYFMKEQNMSREEAEHYVDQRPEFQLSEEKTGSDLIPYKKMQEGGIAEQEVMEEQTEETLSGGLAENVPTEGFNQEELEKGIEVEMEHTDNPEVAEEIAKDHLAEHPHYYDYLELMEREMKEDEPLVHITEEEMEPLPTQDEAEDTLEEMPQGDNSYLKTKPVSHWDEDDIATYHAIKKDFAREQFQSMYDNTSDNTETKQKFTVFAQKASDNLIVDRAICKALEALQSFSEAVDVLSMTGYLNPDANNPNKETSGELIIDQLDEDKEKLTKDYSLSGIFDGQYLDTKFRIVFERHIEKNPMDDQPVIEGAELKYYYVPSDFEILHVTGSDGNEITDVPVDVKQQIDSAINNFRMSVADASEWEESQHEEGGMPNRYTFQEKKAIGAEMLSQIGKQNLMYIGYHNPVVGENRESNPYLAFDASGSAYPNGIRIIITLNTAKDWYNVKAITISKEFDVEEKANYDAVYNEELANRVLDITEGENRKMASGGRIKDADIKVGNLYELPNGEKIEIKRLFVENTDEAWVEFYRDGKKNETSLKQLRIFLNNWNAKSLINIGIEPSGVIFKDEWRVSYFPKSRVPYYFNSKTVQINLSKSYLTKRELKQVLKDIPSAKIREEDDMYKIDADHFDVINNYGKLDDAFKDTIKYKDGGIIIPDKWQYRVMWSFKNKDGVQVWETYDEAEAKQKWAEVTALPKIEVAMLDKNMYDKHETIVDHRSIRMFPKFSEGGQIEYEGKKYIVEYEGKKYYVSDKTIFLNSPKGTLYYDGVRDKVKRVGKIDKNDYIVYSDEDISQHNYKEKALEMGSEIGVDSNSAHRLIPVMAQGGDLTGHLEDCKHKLVKRKNLRGGYNHYKIEAYSETYGYFLRGLKGANDTTATTRELKNDFEIEYAEGGMTTGKSHDDGGEKFIVQSTGQLVELEGGEPVINKTNAQSDQKIVFTEPLTVKQIASCMNEMDGHGVNFRGDDTPCPIKKVE